MASVLPKVTVEIMTKLRHKPEPCGLTDLVLNNYSLRLLDGKNLSEHPMCLTKLCFMAPQQRSSFLTQF